MDDDDRRGLLFISYLHVNRLLPKRWSPPAKRYPSMPRRTWRALASVCFAIGAVIGAIAGRGSAAGTVVAAGFAGLIAVAVGMWVIETIWLRRRNT